MKIHTTQNLGLLSTSQPTNVMLIKDSKKDFLESIQSDKMRMSNYADSVTFKAGNKSEIVKKFIEKAAGKEFMRRIMDSGFFDTLLDTMSHETFIQAAISFLICAFLRPATIMALPAKGKSKDDNVYAASHSMASGAVGLVASALISIPFTKGVKYAQKNLIKNLSEEALKRRYNWINLDSIWVDVKNKALGRKDMNLWLDKYGNKFSTDVKNVMKMAKPKYYTELSEGTYESLGVKLNLKANEGKPFYEWIDEAGEKVVEKLKTKDMCIAIREEGMPGTIAENTNFFSLLHIDKDFLARTLPELDMATVEINGVRQHPSKWRFKGEKADDALKEFLDSIHLSSYRESTGSIPIYTGVQRTETLGKKEVKYMSYQSNWDFDPTRGVPEKLGSPVEQKALDADKATDIMDKFAIWLPDILTRPFVATTTIALLPVILKNIFHMEKPSKKPVQQEPVQLVRKEVA